MAKSEKTFVERHWTGWILAAGTALVGGVGQKIYAAFRGPVEAQIAAGQAEDSVTNFVLHQQASYNDLGFTLILVGTLCLMFMFLLPTLVDIYKRLKHAIFDATKDS